MNMAKVYREGNDRSGGQLIEGDSMLIPGLLFILPM